MTSNQQRTARSIPANDARPLRRLAWTVVVVFVALPLLEIWVRSDAAYHPHFEFERWPGFASWFPLCGVLILVLVAHWWRSVWGRMEARDGS